MVITGARWGLEGAKAVLKLRSLKISGDFDSYWNFYKEKQYDRKYKLQNTISRSFGFKSVVLKYPHPRKYAYVVVI